MKAASGNKSHKRAQPHSAGVAAHELSVSARSYVGARTIKSKHECESMISVGSSAFQTFSLIGTESKIIGLTGADATRDQNKHKGERDCLFALTHSSREIENERLPTSDLVHGKLWLNVHETLNFFILSCGHDAIHYSIFHLPKSEWPK